MLITMLTTLYDNLKFFSILNWLTVGKVSGDLIIQTI